MQIERGRNDNSWVETSPSDAMIPGPGRVAGGGGGDSELN